MRYFVLLLALFAGSAFATDYKSPWEMHFSARLATIEAQAQLIGPGHQVLVGDSNTEAFWWNQVEGCRVINAGMGGANIRDIATRADAIAAATRPAIAHIMLGTNNVSHTEKSPLWDTMQADLMKMVKAFQKGGAKVVLWPVPPVETPFADAAAQERRVYINRIIQIVARATGAYWDWWWPEQIGPGGVANPAALQADGVHFVPQTQVSRYHRINVWRQHIQSHTGVNGC